LITRDPYSGSHPDDFDQRTYFSNPVRVGSSRPRRSHPPGWLFSFGPPQLLAADLSQLKSVSDFTVSGATRCSHTQSAFAPRNAQSTFRRHALLHTSCVHAQCATKPSNQRRLHPISIEAVRRACSQPRARGNSRLHPTERSRLFGRLRAIRERRPFLFQARIPPRGPYTQLSRKNLLDHALGSVADDSPALKL
jgi:hypothetical protein